MFSFHSCKFDLDLPSEIKDWEVSHDDLMVKKLLGLEPTNLEEFSNPLCALMYKEQRCTLRPCDVETFLGEIALMVKVSLDVSSHVVMMVGCIIYISERPLSLIMEYVPLGSLCSCLLTWKLKVRSLAVAFGIAVLFIGIA